MINKPKHQINKIQKNKFSGIQIYFYSMLIPITITIITLLFAATKYALNTILFIMCIIIILQQTQTNKQNTTIVNHITFLFLDFTKQI